MIKLLDSNELCNYFNQRIRKLYVEVCQSPHEDKFIQMKKFYETFANLEHLQCAINEVDDVLSVIEKLPKLSTAKITCSTRGGNRIDFNAFEKIAYKRNIICDIHHVPCISYDKSGKEVLLRTTTTIYMWIGKAII